MTQTQTTSTQNAATQNTAARNASSAVKGITNEMTQSARNVWLAGLGALSTIEDESSQFFDRLVEKGRDADEERQKKVAKVRHDMEAALESTTRKVKSTADDVSSELDQRIAKVLDRMGVPNRKDIESLRQRVEDLVVLVEKAGSTSERAVYHVAPHGDDWKVTLEGTEEAARVEATKDAAVSAARELAKMSEPSQVIIHRQDGTIQTSHSYER